MMAPGKTFEDKRSYSRVIYFAEATLSDSKESWSCQVADLSLKGCLLEFQTPWSGETKSPYLVTLALADDVQITMTVSLAHLEGNKAGFHCQSIGLDSISKLRRLVELNLGDNELLERNLSALAYSKG